MRDFTLQGHKYPREEALKAEMDHCHLEHHELLDRLSLTVMTLSLYHSVNMVLLAIGRISLLMAPGLLLLFPLPLPLLLLLLLQMDIIKVIKALVIKIPIHIRIRIQGVEVGQGHIIIIQ